MNILHAIENSEIALPAAQLITELKFNNPKVFATYVIQRLEEPATSKASAGTTSLIERFLQLQEEGGTAEVAPIVSFYQQAGIPAEARLVSGFTTAALLRATDDFGCKLVTVSGRTRIGLDRFLTGSTSKSLVASSKQSVLVVKEPLKKGEGIRALLATDHSDYCNRAIDSLISFAPRGISEITVLSAFSVELTKALASSEPELPDSLADITRSSLAEANERLVQRLAPISAKCRSIVASAPPLEAIPNAIRESGANLLILGAQGHGFFDRITFGSVSHQLVSTEPCSTLVLRG